MALRYVGKDPDSPVNDSPTVWVDKEDYLKVFSLIAAPAQYAIVIK